MNKLLILTICALLVVLYPVYASNSTNGIDIQQIQNDQDIYGQINTWFSNFFQNSDPVGYITNSSDYKNFVSSLSQANIGKPIQGGLQGVNIQNMINTTMLSGEIQKNINIIMQNIQ
jgi:hypothetical protein